MSRGNLMERAARRFASRRTGVLSSSVVYSRGDKSCTVSAAMAATKFTRTDEGGLNLSDEHRSFIIAAADLVFDGESATFEPAAGDQVRQTIGSVVEVYEVMAPAGEPVWAWHDRFGIERVIHAKRIDQESVE